MSGGARGPRGSASLPMCTAAPPDRRHRMRLVLHALLGVLALAPPALAQGAGQVTPPARDTAACGAIAAAIDSLVLLHRPEPRIVLWHETQPVRERTMFAGQWRIMREMPGLDPSTWASFVRHNQRAEPACGTLPLPNPVQHRSVATDRGRLEGVDAETYWRRFRELYPGAAGSVSTSGVGVSRDGRQALLLIDHGCGSLCGSGHIVLLERDAAGRWRIRAAHMTWVS